MRLREYAVTMAAYNTWMNERLFQCAAKLDDEQRRRDLGAFFKSVHGTLNHILLGDRAWLDRFTGRPVQMKTAGDELYADFDALRRARSATDQQIERWATTLGDTFADAPYSFHSVVYQRDRTTPGWVAIAHLFNHQTHHRGQVTTLLMQLGVDPGITDLPWMPMLD
jgi:uncharacterized damage-inducible protein DinB